MGPFPWWDMGWDIPPEPTRPRACANDRAGQGRPKDARVAGRLEGRGWMRDNEGSGRVVYKTIGFNAATIVTRRDETTLFASGSVAWRNSTSNRA